VRTIVGFLALAALTSAAPRPAEACSCASEAPRVSPADGALDVPINAVIIVAFGHASADPQVELRDPSTGAVIPLTVQPHPAGEGWQLASPGMLEPGTKYEITATSALGSTQTTFVTGAATDVEPIAFAGLASISLETMTYPLERDGSACIDSCVSFGGTNPGHISRIRLGYAPPADAALLVFSLEREDGTVVDQLPIEYGTADGRVLGFSSCEHGAVLEREGRYCGRLVAYDVAGNVTGSQTVVCEDVQTCAPELVADSCTPADTCAAVASDDGGCATTGRGTGAVALVLGLAALARRRRRRQPRRRSAA
jgi:MYXO-CTERM domain-containing protein